MTWKELQQKLNSATEEQLSGKVTVVIFSDVVGWPTSLEVATPGEGLNVDLVPNQIFLCSE